MSRDVNEQPPADPRRTTGNRPDGPRATGVRRAIIALGICAVAISGCSSLERSEPSTSSAVSNREGAATALPAALSPSAYQGKLWSAGSAVAPVFDRLANAGSPEDAHAELEQASAAAWEAARLLDVDPPAEVLAVHRDLLTGLRQLATDLSQLSDQAASMELCAAPSVLASVSNAPGVNSLRTVREVLGSGRLSGSYQWGEFLPAPTPLPERRLANGRLVDSQRRTGSGQLKVDNDTEQDAVVKLVQGGKPIVSVYVGKGSNATVEKINDGTYELFYTTGTDWDGHIKTFTRACQFTRFEKSAKFTTASVRGGREYTIQSLVCNPELEGTPALNWYPPSRFQDSRQAYVPRSGNVRKYATNSSLVPPENARRRKGSVVMNRRLFRIMVSAMSVAMIAGFVGAHVGAAHASAQAAAPMLTVFTSFPQTDPPGYCTPEEMGQVKRGPDGRMYKCVPVGSDPGSINTLMQTGSSA